MKTILNIITIMLVGISCLTFQACTDDDPVAVAQAPSDEKQVVPSTDAVVLEQRDADNQTAISFTWDEAWYGVSTPTTFTLQIDAENGDFSNGVNNVVTGGTVSYTHSQLNAYAIKLGLEPEAVGKLKVRLKGNLKYDELVAYTAEEMISVTPYKTLSLEFPMPTNLYLQGGAVASNWGYPIPDEQMMVQVDDHRFALILELYEWGNFAFITNSAAWTDPAYKAETDMEPYEGGNFIPSGAENNWGGSDIQTPGATGTYKVIMDFTQGTFIVSPEASLMDAPAELFITGEATPLGWDAPDTSQQFTQVDDHTFTLTVALEGGKTYALLTELGWDLAYKGKTANENPMAGDLKASGPNTNPAWGGFDIVAPDTGTYTITVNFKAGTFVLSL
ncbi:SusE domain-containing protein [Pseudotamlana carrageenivorans]|uniref:SusE outer membrane protein domain-containing protein n=1 Tax=Pseudotamlana carrageenivorans TaxID=2069432 RepID=A0A2I7SG63_9FLAO|nr:SusE domain-containing protein [Tamlana carrageenivorans]AUS04896.1 hypothetical protein C1A40_05160 [Tamlana carrageenivorans]